MTEKPSDKRFVSREGKSIDQGFPMKLYLLQHGDAVPESVSPDRPLSEKGRLDMRRLAKFVGWSAVKVNRVFHSGKSRARQSAEIVASEVTDHGVPEVMAGLNPNDPVAPLVEQVDGGAEDTLLVGHMPFLGRLAAQLVCGNQEISVIAFRPGTLVCLERDDSGRWAVAWMLRPELIQG